LEIEARTTSAAARSLAGAMWHSASTFMPARWPASIPACVSFDHQAFVRQHRVALTQQISDTPSAAMKAVGLGLAALDVLSRDNIEKQLAQVRRGGRIASASGAQRAGRDHQRNRCAQSADELLRSGIRAHPVAQ